MDPIHFDSSGEPSRGQGLHLHHLYDSWDARAKRFYRMYQCNVEGASILGLYLKARQVRRLLDVGWAMVDASRSTSRQMSPRLLATSRIGT